MVGMANDRTIQDLSYNAGLIVIAGHLCHHGRQVATRRAAAQNDQGRIDLEEIGILFTLSAKKACQPR
jgi:hypothetical protein